MTAGKKVVLQLSAYEERMIRKKVLAAVSQFTGVMLIAIDYKTGKMTVVGEADIPVIVIKLRKICKIEIVSVEDFKPTRNTIEPAKPTKPADVVAYPYVTYPYMTYANSYYQPYNSIDGAKEPSICVIM